MKRSDESEIRRVVKRASNNDPDAWEWLYRRTHPRLFAYARRRLNSDNAAEEAVSETMTRALEKIGGFRWRGAGFDGWLFGILRNVVLERYRSDGRHTLMDDPAAQEAAPPELGPAATAERRDRAAVLRAAFAQLGDEERELLELRVIGELSSDEVADVVGKRPGAVRMAQARALERLRGLLEEKGLESA